MKAGLFSFQSSILLARFPNLATAPKLFFNLRTGLKRVSVFGNSLSLHLMNFDVQVGYPSGRGFHAQSTETHKPSGLGNLTPTYSTPDFDCQSSLGFALNPTYGY